MNAINSSLAQQPSSRPMADQRNREALQRILRQRAQDTIRSLPLSHGQQALWFLHQSSPDSSAYHIGFALRIRSEVDSPALRRALQRLIDRHPMLRAKFRVQDGMPMQEVAGTGEAAFRLINVSDCDEQALRKQVLAAYAEPFDLAQGSLMRTHLFQHGPDDAVLLLTVHHIVYDGWSLWLNLDELRTLYGAEVSGLRAALPAPEFSYEDYVHRQRQQLEGAHGERLWSYWRDQLDGEIVPLSFPTDRPRPPLQRYQGASVSTKLDVALSQRLMSIAKSEGVTPFTLLLAAFQTLLHRYTGQDDFLVGTPTGGSDRSDYAHVVGYFVNQVPLRARFHGNPTFKAFLRHTRDTVLGAIEHQDFPFPMLVERLCPERDPSYAPLVQVSFVYQKSQRGDGMGELLNRTASAQTVDWSGLAVQLYDLPQQEGQFDLELEMLEAGDRLFGVFKYDTDLYDAETIHRMAGHFEQLLQGIALDPAQTVSTLPLLSADQRSELVQPRQQLSQAVSVSLIDLFSQQVERNPDAVALEFAGTELSYRELNQRANQLAHHLLARHVGPEVRVGLYVERSPELIIGLLGILKAGGVYVPIDPGYPDDRIRFMLDDAGVKVLVSSETCAASLADLPLSCVLLDRQWSTIAEQRRANPRTEVNPENAAYVIYTSGSTGTPKGVEVTHANVARLFFATDRWFGFTANDVWTLFHSVAFDFSVWELWGALLHGGKLVVVPFDVSRSPDAFYRLLVTQGVTVLNQTPSAFQQLIRAEEQLGADLTRLRWVIFGGEALELQTLQPWFERHGDASPQLVNMYGITETTVHVTYRPLKQADLRRNASVIGQPISDLELYILDREREPVPVGVVGELYVGGAGLARGYLNRPQLNEQRFIAHPFSRVPGARLYRSGDLARYLPDGDIEYLGRADHQVKLRGFRIELGEIESLLCQHSQLREAVVLAREDRSGDKRLVAYVVPSAESVPSRAELRAHLKQRLPDYMVPAAFVTLDALPLTANGKVDRRALPAPNASRHDTDTPSIAPRNSTEQRLVAIWQRVLAVQPISVQDNFFELGGHSLLAVRLVAEIELEFGDSLALSSLMQNPTVEQLAVAMQGSETTPWSPLVAMRKEGSLTPFFCVAGGGGNVLYLNELANRLDAARPIYGLQSRGLDGNTEPLRRVEDIARQNVAAIRQIQPQGPYLLGGHCFGGVVAFAMAQLLRRQDEQVALVAVIDVPAPVGPPMDTAAWEDATWIMKIAGALEEASGKSLGLDSDHLSDLQADDQLEYLRARMQAVELLPAEAGTGQVRGFVNVFKANSQARYEPTDTLPVPIALLRAQEVHPDYDYSAADDPNVAAEQSSLGWRTFADDCMQVRSIPGNHLTMLSGDNSEQLARQLDCAFDQALSNVGQRPESERVAARSTALASGD